MGLGCAKGQYNVFVGSYPANTYARPLLTCTQILRRLRLSKRARERVTTEHVSPVVGPCCFCLPERRHPAYHRVGREDRGIQRRLEVRRPENLPPPFGACMLTPALRWLHA